MSGIYSGDWRSQKWAVAHPLFILVLTAFVAHFTGVTDTVNTDWKKTFLNIGLMSSTGILMALLTKEGFFRGWLWGTLKHAGQSDRPILALTTPALVLWHTFAVVLDTGLDLRGKEIPI